MAIVLSGESMSVFDVDHGWYFDACRKHSIQLTCVTQQEKATLLFIPIFHAVA